ncbi:hypothetical protein [Saccharospirillum mangrovi]|uniref:phosphoribosyltransferase-like protein n=1 Tax=Saccharospirillum mangrovi TaxID=2161747 RepID=UPI0013002AC2|nr:hypothetical protein [Saccharospirillum mangrovi]
MASLSEEDTVRSWLDNFEDQDRQAAIDLVNEVLLVSRDDFVEELNSLLDSISGSKACPKKIALYAERPVKKVFGNTPCFFPNSRHGRAEGSGVPPIVADPRNQEVGSEGIVANLITDYSRRKGGFCFSHPGPNKLRSEKVRVIGVVTDFIGSGQRIIRMLDSLGSVATLNSWTSYKLIKFVVLAYSGTTEGLKAVRSHRLRPEVLVVMGCPTIQNSFVGERRKEVERICHSQPKRHPEPLGFLASGALIAFSHGCPNNTPPILHSRRSGWRPLFRGRSTSELPSELFRFDECNAHDQRTHRLLNIRDARNKLDSSKNEEWVTVLKVLAAAEKGLKDPGEISARVRMKINTVDNILMLAIQARWLNCEHRLTQLGMRELARFRRRRRKAPLLVGSDESFYYPTQLRAL